MNRAFLCMILASLFGCGIDDRAVELNRTCVDPAENGAIVDAHELTQRGCPAGYCERDLVGHNAVSLGEGTWSGIVFPYAAPGLDPVTLATVDRPSAPSERRLLMALDSVPAPADAPSAASGAALRYVDCIDASAHSTLTFTVDTTNGRLGTCPLRFGLQFLAPGKRTFGETVPVDAYEDGVVVPVTEGTNTFPFAGVRPRDASTALAGMQWEFSVPSDDPAGCSAYFAIDDIRLSTNP